MKNSIYLSTLKLSIVFTISLFVQSAVIAAGVIDRTFGTNGTVTINVGSQTTITDVAAQPDGKILVAGVFNPTASNTDIFLARYHPNGSVDINFGSNGVTVTSLSDSEFISDIELQSDGKIVAVGRTNTPTGANDFLVLRYDQKGRLDITFGNNGVVTVNREQGDNLTKAAIQPDGKIVAVGGTSDGNLLIAAMRFNPNGTLDGSFAVGGLAFNRLPQSQMSYFYSSLRDVEILPDGRILTGGTFDAPFPGVDHQIGYYVQMLRNDGSLDTAFGIQGILRAADFARLGWALNGFDAEVLPDGRVAIADGTGVRVTNFNGSEKYFPQDGNTIAPLPNGKFVVSGGRFGGYLKTYSKQSLIGTAWNLLSDKMTAQPDGKIVTAKNFVGGAAVLTRVAVIASQGTRLANYSRDSRTDFSVYRPSDKTLYTLTNGENGIGEVVGRTINNQPSAIFPEYSPLRTLPYRIWRETLVYWNNGTMNNSQGSFSFERFSTDPTNFRSFWGATGDVPFGGDFDGDGLIDVGVFRPSSGIWYGLSDSTFGQRSDIVQWGQSGDRLVPADYDFDGKTDYAVYRPSTGTWWIRRSSDETHFGVQFGNAADVPLTGDYDGDGRADLVVFRPGNGVWYQFLTSEGFRAIQFGLSTDIPVPGDYDGDGKHDIAVFRQGVWYLLQSAEGFKAVQWGINGDAPISARYD